MGLRSTTFSCTVFLLRRGRENNVFLDNSIPPFLFGVYAVCRCNLASNRFKLAYCNPEFNQEVQMLKTVHIKSVTLAVKYRNCMELWLRWPRLRLSVSESSRKGNNMKQHSSTTTTPTAAAAATATPTTRC